MSASVNVSGWLRNRYETNCGTTRENRMAKIRTVELDVLLNSRRKIPLTAYRCSTSGPPEKRKYTAEYK
jgi:hypothetical protein